MSKPRCGAGQRSVGEPRSWITQLFERLAIDVRGQGAVSLSTRIWRFSWYEEGEAEAVGGQI